MRSFKTLTDNAVLIMLLATGSGCLAQSAPSIQQASPDYREYAACVTHMEVAAKGAFMKSTGFPAAPGWSESLKGAAFCSQQLRGVDPDPQIREAFSSLIEVYESAIESPSMATMSNEGAKGVMFLQLLSNRTH